MSNLASYWLEGDYPEHAHIHDYPPNDGAWEADWLLAFVSEDEAQSYGLAGETPTEGATPVVPVEIPTAAYNAVD